MVGINYSSRASASQYFAIKAATAIQVVEELKKGADFESIGINGTAVASDDGSVTGIWVASVKSRLRVITMIWPSGARVPETAVSLTEGVFQLFAHRIYRS